MKRTSVAILGATGSIGSQALQVIATNRERFDVTEITASQQVEKLVELCHQFSPQRAVIANPSLYDQLKEGLKGLATEALAGEDALEEVASSTKADVVLSSLVGFSGLRPTIRAIERGKTIALANKEVLVAGGSYVMRLAKKHQATILPVDSEHAAIYQCLLGETSQPEKIWLTASGGPFLNLSPTELHSVTTAEALNHPRWKMGKKVTIDSATLANKAFEVIEARWLFNIPAEDIEVLIHPESIVHSMVLFADGSVKAQLSEPDMRLPISFALGLGERLPNNYSRLNLVGQSLTFKAPDLSRFPMLGYAYEVLLKGGNAGAILNAANSVAVEAFLEGSIRFTDIVKVSEAMLKRDFYTSSNSLDTILATDQEVTEAARSYIKQCLLLA